MIKKIYLIFNMENKTKFDTKEMAVKDTFTGENLTFTKYIEKIIKGDGTAFIGISKYDQI